MQINKRSSREKNSITTGILDSDVHLMNLHKIETNQEGDGTRFAKVEGNVDLFSTLNSHPAAHTSIEFLVAGGGWSSNGNGLNVSIW